ncbi:MAG: tetratricopeptide repeat protein [Pseudomonadales bacterium]|nr:tetratricopeptide repeat protein [Pseudomonadales bacterium]
MDVYRTEEEQVEAIKKWWQANGNNILMGIGLAIFAVFGWQYWNDTKRAAGEAASTVYDQLLQAEQKLVTLDAASEEYKTEVGNLNHLIEQLRTDHAETQYAVFAALFEAKRAVAAGDADKAEEALRWALTNNATEGNRLIIQLRLARVLAMKGEHQAALDMIEKIDAGAQTSAYEEVKGDLYLALDQSDKARAAYKKALDSAGENANQQRPLLKMKYDNLAVAE